MKFTYITLARDCGKIPFYVTDDDLVIFETKQEAFDAALKEATDEADLLGEGCDEGISFGIPEDELYSSNEEVQVCCYSDDDDTEIVTRRIIRRIK